MNPALNKLQPYPFERLRALLAGAQPPSDLSHIAMYIGEPRHPSPPLVVEALTKNMEGLGSYPLTAGLPQLREAIANWLTRRFKLPAGSVSPETMVLPVNGTREALFAFVQAVTDPSKQPLLVMPNPFYQIYEGAALLAGAEPYFMPNDAEHSALPDLDGVPAEVWKRCQVLFLCSPSNPTGAVASIEYLRRALQLAEQYDFVIASDECYSEIYFDETQPPAGLLQAAAAAGNTSYERCIVFHSLSKRSSVPGLRSGFVAGDAKLLKPFLLYRTYHGSAMPPPAQFASIAAWNDEAHVLENRNLYRKKFAAVMPILGEVMPVQMPQASFYLWPRVDNDERFVRQLFERRHITLLPGSYIARPNSDGVNPGSGRVRISLVAKVSECVEAATRIRDFFQQRK
ncbi:succinyldiaminopimelate transaminase [Steroidobacter sp. S1-65]|uniref:Succinyldiaminopimelate transaminase n=1 Tax=Steroidobacter gossypii TaxID=2805490 RepID=A0ABS1WVR0_9GAMM|nr:succinyldiaminopimelate transaminase [Steroidobacter gossypii]MBM0105060.1 succinyldiaminopimelate transaminase [Steroidobacter gossypii]